MIIQCCLLKKFNENTGGVTKYRGGCRIFIIPAGYVGCAFWAGLFVSMSGSRIGGTIVAAGMSSALLISLWYVSKACISIIERLCYFCLLKLVYLWSLSVKLQTEWLGRWYIIGLHGNKCYCDTDWLVLIHTTGRVSIIILWCLYWILFCHWYIWWFSNSHCRG